MEADRVLAFRLARSGLAVRGERGLAAAAACPASDFSRDAALMALAARVEGLTRAAYDEAVDAGGLVVAHVIRGAIHAVAPDDHALWGRALVAGDDAELLPQLGEQVKRLAAVEGFAPTEALDEVTGATRDALADGRALDRVDLHEELRQRVRPALLPWCKGCGSHHVAPMLWRYATVKAGARLDSGRRYRLGEQSGTPPAASGAVRRFLRVYGPAQPAGFGEWAGLARPHARRLWDEVADEMTEVDGTWLLTEDAAAVESPPAAEGIRLLPPGDPYLQKPNRPLLTPEPELRKRLFRPVASPGAVLQDGRLAGLWRMKAKGGKAELTVEPLVRLRQSDVAAEAHRVAALRGATVADVVVS